MMKKIWLLLFSLVVIAGIRADAQTLGLLKHTSGSYDGGYVLFAPLNSTETYLIDKCGKYIHSWHSQYPPGLCTYLLPDGSILRGSSITGGGQGGTSITEKISWDGKVLWSFLLDSVQGQHHDIEPLPNGNVLIISHEPRTRAEVLAKGRKPALLGGQFLSDKIVELEPVGANGANVVWEWHPWDHLVQDFDSTKTTYGAVGSHPELIDINFPAISVGEWLHVNSVKYNAALDQIAISVHNSGEIWVVDHSTSIAQAASHKGGRYGKGGDLLYRWGNAAAYRHGTTADQKFFGQHDAMWIAKGLPHAGEMSVFNNGAGRPGLLYSSVDRIVTPVDGRGVYRYDSTGYAPVVQNYSYFDTTAGEVMFTQTMGGAEMLKNGNFLMSVADAGVLIEADSNGKQVWKYVSPVTAGGILAQGELATGNQFFKARFYPGSYGAFAGRTLTPGAPLELRPDQYDCTPNDTTSAVSETRTPSMSVFAYPNPASDHLSFSSAGHGQVVRLFNMLGKQVAEAASDDVINTASLAGGIYTAVITSGGISTTSMISIVH